MGLTIRGHAAWGAVAVVCTLALGAPAAAQRAATTTGRQALTYEQAFGGLGVADPWIARASSRWTSPHRASGSTRATTSRRGVKTAAAGAPTSSPPTTAPRESSGELRRDRRRPPRMPRSASSRATTIPSASPLTAASAVSRRPPPRKSTHASRRTASGSPTPATATSTPSTSAPAASGASPPTAARRCYNGWSSWVYMEEILGRPHAIAPSGGRRTRGASPSCASTTLRCPSSRSTTRAASTGGWRSSATRRPEIPTPGSASAPCRSPRAAWCGWISRSGPTTTWLSRAGPRRQDALGAVAQPRPGHAAALQLPPGHRPDDPDPRGAPADLGGLVWVS